MSLSYAEYGKDNVRVAKRDIDPATGVETFTEMTVRCLLSGDIEKSYTVADNSSIVATDSIKNTIHIKAKQHQVNPPEVWASTLAQHFLDKYPHISDAHVNLVVHRWSRMTVGGKPHPHSFWRDGNEKHTVEVRANRAAGIEVISGIVDLLVLKSTGSQFHGFVRDEYTTLPETWDRILSTSITANWTWKLFPSLAEVERKKDAFAGAAVDARTITFKLFAEQNSPSVQDTMHKMCLAILDAAPDVAKVDYSLPNKHYFEINLDWHNGLKNTGKDATVYAPQDSPNGLIKCAVTRQKSRSLL